MFKPIVISTGDGSDTLFVEEISEQYHSLHGAIAESEHVFIRNGYLQVAQKGRLNVLEIGFGTGLNCLLTALEANKTACHTRYFSVEKFPLEPGIVSRLNYPHLTGVAGDSIFRTIHAAPWGEEVSVTPFFSLYKVRDDFTTSAFSEIPECQVLYFDAFGPDKQPEMWTPKLFRKVAVKMSPGGVLTTYCAKGAVRRNLRDAGFLMERLPGPKGKREMLRGIKMTDSFL